MKFWNAILLTLGLMISAPLLSEIAPGGSGSPATFPNGLTVTTGAVDLGPTAAEITAGTACSTGNVCSGVLSATCVNVINITSCSGTMTWMRVGNVVTVGLSGFNDPTASNTLTEFDITNLPFAVTNFANQAQGGGVCGSKSDGSLVDFMGDIRPVAGTTNMRVGFNKVSHLFNSPLFCSFSYQVL